ncbi:MAG: zinc ribbon domain-containing protein [Anaerolineae bacterium]|nr:zinc ribbon domain-containing protein [Anaerolineae bacterium]
MANKVEQRLYHGKIDPEDLARTLVIRFDQGETRAHWMRGEDKRAVVQVQSRSVEMGDPNTAVTIHVTPTQTGITVAVSEQKWLGVAADLAKSGMMSWLNPMNLLHELDDIARNVRWLRLRTEIWQAVDEYAQSRGSGLGAAPLLSSVVCPYCGTPNDMGAHNCQACHAPLAEAQPVICPKCGSLNNAGATVCANCHTSLT